MCYIYYERIAAIKLISLERGNKELLIDSYVESTFKSEKHQTFLQRLLHYLLEKKINVRYLVKTDSSTIF